MRKLLIIGQVWPEPDSSAAGSRMLQLIGLFLEHRYKITYASTAAESDHAVDLVALGLKTQIVPLNNSRFDSFLKEENPEIVMFDRFMVEEQFGWRVAQICPNALRILDTEDLHFLRKARQKALEENQNFKKTDLFSDIAKREIASIFRCDMSLIISEAEKKLLLEQFKIDENLLCYLPFLLNGLLKTELETLPSFEEREHFVSIGNFLHPPNWDKVYYLKNEIWPLIRKELPDVELHLYGAYAPEKAMRLHDPKSGFFMEGKGENVKRIFENARIVLAPLRFGAGLKGKFFDAMQSGTPCVTTTIGAEGICGALPWCGEIANTPETLAKAAIVLYQSKARWGKAQKAGFEIIHRRFRKSFLPNLLCNDWKLCKKICKLTGKKISWAPC